MFQPSLSSNAWAISLYSDKTSTWQIVRSSRVTVSLLFDDDSIGHSFIAIFDNHLDLELLAKNWSNREKTRVVNKLWKTLSDIDDANELHRVMSALENRINSQWLIKGIEKKRITHSPYKTSATEKIWFYWTDMTDYDLDISTDFS